MDIKINANGRYIELTNVNATLEEATDVALGLWLGTEKAKQDGDELEAGSSIITERSDSQTGFALLADGERLDVR